MEALVMTNGTTGAVMARPGLDLEALYTRFIDFIQVRQRSLETYKKALKQFFNYLGARGITEPTRLDIIAYNEQMKAEGKKPTTAPRRMGGGITQAGAIDPDAPENGA